MIDFPSAESARKLMSIVSMWLFTLSFILLLLLSATDQWTPANPWLARLHGVFRVAGATALILALIPPLQRTSKRVAGWLGFQARR